MPLRYLKEIFKGVKTINDFYQVMVMSILKTEEFNDSVFKMATEFSKNSQFMSGSFLQRIESEMNKTYQLEQLYITLKLMLN